MYSASASLFIAAAVSGACTYSAAFVAGHCGSDRHAAERVGDAFQVVDAVLVGAPAERAHVLGEQSQLACGLEGVLGEFACGALLADGGA
jgi:hypothetical protein